MSTNNAEDLDDMSFNMESVDEMVGGIVKGKELMSENVDKVVKSSYAIDSKKKKEFDEKREEVLSEIPRDVYKLFGAIRFASFSKFVGPVFTAQSNYLFILNFCLIPKFLSNTYVKCFCDG